MSKSKSRKKKAPKCVLALPDLEHAKTRSVAETVRRGRFGIMLQTLQVAETQQGRPPLREASCDPRAGAHLNLPQKEQVMAFMLVRSKVRDFKTWKPAYDAHLPARNDAGLTEKYLLRNADDANEIVILFEAQDLNRAKTFAASADLRERMQESGVVDKPDIYFLDR